MMEMSPMQMIQSEDTVDVGEENVTLHGPRLLARTPHIQLTNRNSHAESCSS